MSLAALATRGQEIQRLDAVMSEIVHDKIIGRHHFVVYEGDVEYGLDDRTGLMVPQNPVIFETPVVKNLITDGGKGSYLDRLGGMSSVAAFTSLGVGTDSTAAAAGQTKLNPSVAGSVLIQAVDATYPSRASLVATWKSTFGTGVANFQWNEAAIFNGTVNNTSLMFNRVIIGPYTKSASASIAYSTTITQG